jgi:hypothetical protein
VTLSEFQRIRDIVSQVNFPGYEFIVDWCQDNAAVFVRHVEADVDTSCPEEQRGRPWLVTNKQTEGQIVDTCLKALLTSLEHRGREHFTYKNKAVFQPHFYIDQLLAIAPSR